MIPKDCLHRDIDKICELTSSLYGFYTQLHQYDKNGNPEKLPEFIQNAQKLMGDKAALYLYNAGIIRQQQGGTYDFNFPTEVMDGGGMAYNNIGREDGFDYRMAYFFDDKTPDDTHNIYHELGHLMQYRLNLFNSKEISCIYRFFSKGISKKKMSKSEITRRFVDSSSYTSYLLESHANAFACACLLLRTNNRKERIKQSLNNYIRAGSVFFEGLRDSEKLYPGMKYYSSLPIQKAVIRKVNQWFKNGEISKYKDANGEIDFDSVAVKVHEIVMEKAFSPRTFKQFLDMDFTALHPRKEQGWRHSVPEAVATRLIHLFDVKTRKSLKERTDIHEKFDLERHVNAFKPLPETDDAARLLNLCCRIDNATIDLYNCAEALEIDVPKYDELDLDCAIYYGGLPDSVVKTLSAKIMHDYNLDKDETEILLQPYQQEINKLLAVDYDKELLCNVMGAMNRPECREMLWQMYRDRSKNPKAEICPDAVQIPGEIPSIKAVQKAEGRLFKDVRRIIMSEIGNGENDTKINKLRLHILNTASQNPEALNTKEFADKALLLSKADIKEQELRDRLDKLHTLYFMDKDIFTQSLRKYSKQLVASLTSPQLHQTKKSRGIER